MNSHRNHDTVALAWSLRQAVLDGNAQSALQILEADPQAARVCVDGSFALIHAAANGHVECLKALIPFGDLRAVDQTGRTALFMSVFMEETQAMRLLAPISDVNQPDAHGRTPLMIAADAAYQPGMRLLAPLSDLALADADGHTAFDHAEHCVLAQPGEAAHLLSILREAKAKQEREALAQVLRESQSESGSAAPRPEKRPRSL